MECSIVQNIEKCKCSYEGCPRKGKCCECLSYHWSKRELPGCLFPEEIEKTYNRSLTKFIEIYK